MKEIYWLQSFASQAQKKNHMMYTHKHRSQSTQNLPKKEKDSRESYKKKNM